MGLPLRTGQVVMVDRRDAILDEPAKHHRPVFAHDEDLLDDDDLIAIVLSLTEDAEDTSPALAAAIAPVVENGCGKRCFAGAADVTAASKRCVRPTGHRVTEARLAGIRRRIALVVGAA